MSLLHFKPELFLISPTGEPLQGATGDHAKGIAVIAQLKEGAEAAELDLLNKILKSIQLDEKNDTLLLKTTPSTRFSLTAVCRQAECHTFLLFGGDPKNLGLHFRMEKNTPFEINGLKGLWTDPLSMLDQSRELKTALWSGLQALFV